MLLDDPEADAGVLGRALSGNAEVLPRLVDRWTPVIQARIVRILRRRGGVDTQRSYQEVEELVQQVFLSLFDRGGEALRAWSPNRGLSLDNWVGLIAERQVLSLIRTRKRNPWSEEPTAIEDLDRSSTEPDPERAALGRDILDRLLDGLQERLSPLGWQLFRLLYVEELEVAEAARRCSMSPAAIYAWRSRLRRLAQSLGRELLSESNPQTHRPLTEAGNP